MEMVTAGFMTGPPVRVQRNGNSKVLPLPAELARSLHVELGEVYTVELAGDDVIYHRTSGGSRVSMHGSGGNRFGVVPDSEVMAAPQRASVPALDWDF